MNTITFYFGMSGTFKTTTILDQQKKYKEECIVVWSMIKLWKDLESSDYFSGHLEKLNHLNYSALHLCILGNSLRLKKNLPILVERGVSDSLFYHFSSSPDTPLNYQGIVDKESEMCRSSGYSRRNILLVQRDENFIETTILKEPHRREIFANSTEYLKSQEKYIEFTTKYNKIDEIITINDAQSYLFSLGIN